MQNYHQYKCIQNKLCVTVKRTDEKLTSENMFKVVRKKKEAKEKPGSFVLNERPFFGKFDLKNQNCQFRLKFGTYNQSQNN